MSEICLEESPDSKKDEEHPLTIVSYLRKEGPATLIDRYPLKLIRHSTHSNLWLLSQSVISLFF